MTTLQVSLDYSSTEYAPAGAQQTPFALPLRVLDADGTLLAEQAASTTEPARFDMAGIEGPVFVRLIWPSGKSVTRRVALRDGEDAHLRFSDDAISRNEWAAWAVPRLSERSRLVPQAGEQPLAAAAEPPAIARFDRVWLRMWVREGTTWSAARPAFKDALRSDFARQFEFDLPPRCHLLQIGGQHLPWRFVALPGAGACRVLIAPNESTDPRAEPLKVVVSSYRRDAENLLEFLSRDALRAAGALREFGPLATRLLSDKHDDPVSAAAAAYFLLRSDGWRAIPQAWFERLAGQFDWLADTALVQCVVKLRSGLSTPGDAAAAVAGLRHTLARGVPVFSEGMALLREAAGAMSQMPDADLTPLLDHIDHLTAAETWSGAALSYAGIHPDQPSPERVFGMPGRPRAARSDLPRAGEPASTRASGRAALRAQDERVHDGSFVLLGALSG